MQYKIKQITVREKSVAIALLGRLQQGESFEVVARGLPVGVGRVTSGWINPNQIPFDVSDAIARLPIGGVVEAPIFTEGAWLIIRLEDKRSGSSLGFEEYKNQVVQLKLRDFYAQLLRQLRSQASIHQ